eukprot:COSAG01_NODE_3257_length_6345_cov_4.979987_2_plen_298_part_00
MRRYFGSVQRAALGSGSAHEPCCGWRRAWGHGESGGWVHLQLACCWRRYVCKPPVPSRFVARRSTLSRRRRRQPDGSTAVAASAPAPTSAPASVDELKAELRAAARGLANGEEQWSRAALARVLGRQALESTVAGAGYGLRGSSQPDANSGSTTANVGVAAADKTEALQRVRWLQRKLEVARGSAELSAVDRDGVAMARLLDELVSKTEVLKTSHEDAFLQHGDSLSAADSHADNRLRDMHVTVPLGSGGPGRRGRQRKVGAAEVPVAAAWLGGAASGDYAREMAVRVALRDERMKK